MTQAMSGANLVAIILLGAATVTTAFEPKDDRWVGLGLELTTYRLQLDALAVSKAACGNCLRSLSSCSAWENAGSLYTNRAYCETQGPGKRSGDGRSRQRELCLRPTP